MELHCEMVIVRQPLNTLDWVYALIAHGLSLFQQVGSRLQASRTQQSGIQRHAFVTWSLSSRYVARPDLFFASRVLLKGLTPATST